MFDRGFVKIAGKTIEDAAIFQYIRFSAGKGKQADNEHAEYLGAFKLATDNKVLKLGSNSGVVS
jgi:hypothetical protein